VKKLAFAAAMFALCATAASAADLAARPYTKAPVMVEPVSDWTGFYIGINGGGVWGRTNTGVSIGDPNTFFTPLNEPTVAAVGSNRINNSGGIAGGQVGYLWQAGKAVFGLEAAFDWMNAKGSISRAGIYPQNAPTTFGFNETVSTDWLFTFLGRVGFDAGGWMPYVTGGLAVSDLKYTNVFTDTFYPSSGTATFSQTKVGYAVGAGAEWKFNSNWSVRGEYLYVAFNDITGSSRVAVTAAPAINFTFGHSATFTENVARVAVSYRFGGPVVAKY
jgi:outer membrane immunogenic protein